MPDKPEKLRGDRPREGPLVEEQPSIIEDLEEGSIETKELEHKHKPIERNNDSYYKLLKLAFLWHKRLGHISLSLLKKTARIT